MEHRGIGSLTASVVGLGCNQFGTKWCDPDTSVAVINEALDAGITWFDTADEYGSNYFDPSDPAGWGRSEEILGQALKGRRDEVMIATKFGVQRHGSSDEGGASARWARIAVEDSLRRLDTDRIDLYQVHIPDADVPIDETLGALAEMVRAGKVREIGCCNFSADQVAEAAEASAATGHPRFVSLQGQLNLFSRRALVDSLPACEKHGLSFVPYYPLASGVLTGKYRRDAPIPSRSRISEQVSEEARERILSERAFARVEALEAWATERGHTLLELAFAWLLAQPTVATVIAGAARPGQPSSNAAAGAWRITAGEADEVTALVASAA